MVGTGEDGLAQEAGVRLYEHPDYDGDSRYFSCSAVPSSITGVSNLDLDNINFADVASSVQLYNVKKVVLYDQMNYGPDSLVLTGDISNLSDRGFNDKTGSLRIYALDPPGKPSSPAVANVSSSSFVTSWLSSTGANGYLLDVSTNSSFTSRIPGYDSKDVGSPTSATVAGVSAGTRYYWRVRAYNAVSALGAFSNTVSVLTLPTAPTLAITNISNSSFSLVWSSSPGATSYKVDVATDQAFSIPVSGYINKDVGNATQSQVSGLNALTLYYCRVRSANSTGSSVNSNVVSIQTAPIPPTATGPSSITSSSFVANWSSSTGATGYRIDVATDSGFAALVQGYDNKDIGNTTTSLVTGLLSGTTYFYRVRAYNSTSQSTSSNTMPVQVGLLAPQVTSATNATTTSFDANWSSSSGAMGYQIDVATDSSFTAPVQGYDDKDVGNVLDCLVTGLGPGTSYYFRIRAYGSTGASAWSSFVAVMTALAPPVADSATNVTDQGFDANWSSCIGASGYRIDVATDSQFDSLVAGHSDTDVGNVLTYHVTVEKSVHRVYCYRVRAFSDHSISDNSNTVTVDMPESYPSNIKLEKTYYYRARASLKEYDSTDYQLVGLPGNSCKLISSFLESDGQGVDWMVYWDNGLASSRPEDYYVSYNGDTNFLCTTGRSFWVLHRGDWSIVDTVAAPTGGVMQTAIIPLRAGRTWYSITNPFNRAIPWDSILAVNNVNGALWSWTQTGWEIVNSFVPYEGYMFFNDSGLTDMVVPWHLTRGGTLFVKQSVESGWRVNVVVKTGKWIDGTTCFGVSSDAQTGADRLEQHRPRAMGLIARAYFDRPEWDERFPDFSTDIRPVVNDVEDWEFVICTKTGDTTHLTFTNIGNLPPEYSIYLVDEERGQSVNLRERSSYSFVANRVETKMHVLVGTPSHVRLRAEGALVTAYSLGANYPNPFNNATTIPVEVPSASWVSVDVYTVLGQRVRRLIHEVLEPGRHYLKWDGLDEYGKSVTSGVYFLSMCSGDKVYTRPAILVK
jgi:hypothetical protein